MPKLALSIPMNRFIRYTLLPRLSLPTTSLDKRFILIISDHKASLPWQAMKGGWGLK